MEILLNENRSIDNINSDKHLSLYIENEGSSINISNASTNFDVQEQYFKEKDGSNKYRIIASVKPVCTNALFNKVTEIIYKEGSDECVSFNPSGLCINLASYKGLSKFTNSELIRDTSYSHSDIGPLVYHCGVDIFSNHWLRQKNYLTLPEPKYDEDENALRYNFNTIEDYKRSSAGKIVKEKLSLNDNTKTKMHLYKFNDIKRFNKVIRESIIEKDGWFGFLNKSTVSIPNYNYNGKMLTFDRCLLNNKGNEQIDFYPDRTLFSFTPKLNKYRHRPEYNWDVCITYPYKNYYDNILVTDSNGINGIECEIVLSDDKVTTFSDSVTFKSKIQNSFVKGDTVSITITGWVASGNTSGNTSGTTLIKTTEVIDDVTILSYTDAYNFQISYLMIKDIIDEFDNDSETKFRFRKRVNGIDCKYYLRKFKRVPNTNVINYNNQEDTDFSATINKLGFAKTIFNDDISQIIFNEDVDISNLCDNCGRPLTEIYITIIKANRGYKEWYYGSTDDKRSEDVEYSHCFGPVSSGFNLATDIDDYNVRKIHNINIQMPGTMYINESPSHLEEDITIEGGIENNVFLGDIVEFYPYKLEEIVLEDIYHRFNTVQREFTTENYNDNPYFNIVYDDIKYDDYDAYYDKNGQLQDSFTIEQKTYNISEISEYTLSKVTGYAYAGNLDPEGYYYRPHYPIKLRNFKNEIFYGYHTEVLFENKSESPGDTQIIKTEDIQYVSKGDILFLYRYTEKRRYNAVITNVKKDLKTLTIRMDSNISNIYFDIDEYKVFKPSKSLTSQCYDLEDESGIFFWREIEPSSSTTVNDELYDSMFTNNAHYRYTNINFYLKRQDGWNDYGMKSEEQPVNLVNTTVTPKYLDVSDEEYTEEGATTSC